MLKLAKTLAVALCALAAAASVASADGVVQLGLAGDNSGGTTLSPDCNIFGYADAGTPSYEIPFDGVLSWFVFRQGAAPVDATTARLRTFRVTGAVDPTIVHAVAESEGDAHAVTLAAGGFASFYDRVRAAAGDRLGIEIATGANAGNAQCRFNSSSTSDRVGFRTVSAPLGTEQNYNADPVITKVLPNVLATLEHDTDRDGFGDTTQDLCTGDAAHATGACSGTLVGAPISGGDPGGHLCGYSCVRFQKTIGGAPDTAPYDGVIVRWRVKAGNNLNAQLRVMHLVDDYWMLMDHSSSRVSVTTATAGAITTIPSRIPIAKGDYVGIGLDGGDNLGTIPDPGSTAYQLNDLPDGSQNGYGGYSALPQQLKYDYDIERDADHDGYGDETQDRCPTDPVEQGICPAPLISGLKFTPRSFAVATKGKAVAAAKQKRGGAISAALTKASAVSFVVSRKTAGRRAGKRCVKQTKKNLGRRRCAFLRKVHAFSRDLAAGPVRLGYSGRYRASAAAKRIRSLAPGSYSISATPLSSLSLVSGKTARTTFKVVSAAKHH